MPIARRRQGDARRLRARACWLVLGAEDERAEAERGCHRPRRRRSAEERAHNDGRAAGGVQVGTTASLSRTGIPIFVSTPATKDLPMRWTPSAHDHGGPLAGSRDDDARKRRGGCGEVRARRRRGRRPRRSPRRVHRQALPAQWRGIEEAGGQSRRERLVVFVSQRGYPWARMIFAFPAPSSFGVSEEGLSARHTTTRADPSRALSDAQHLLPRFALASRIELADARPGVVAFLSTTESRYVRPDARERARFAPPAWPLAGSRAPRRRRDPRQRLTGKSVWIAEDGRKPTLRRAHPGLPLRPRRPGPSHRPGAPLGDRSKPAPSPSPSPSLGPSASSSRRRWTVSHQDRRGRDRPNQEGTGRRPRVNGVQRLGDQRHRVAQPAQIVQLQAFFVADQKPFEVMSRFRATCLGGHPR